MSRHKDNNWDLATPPTIPGAAVAVLMDIRDELKEINRSLAPLRCHNFLRIPAILDQVNTNTRKRSYKKKPS